MKNINLKNITQILPHRNPMLMVDNYKRINNDTAAAEKTFYENDYGCENGFVIDSILIECIAQTIAAHYGYQSLIKKEKNPDSGMLVAVDIFNFYHPVLEKSKINIFVSQTDEIGSFKLFKGEIRMRNKIMATGNLKVFIAEKEGI